MKPWVVYVRRSYVKSGAPDVSDEAQETAAAALVPAGTPYDVIADTGGHHSGRNDRRDGYRELIARVEAGDRGGLAVYDLSRLARNARLMLTLHHALERAGMPLAIANMPATRWDTATGRFMLGQLALAAQFQADVDSERMTGLMRTLFEDGRHRGQDPFGYRSARDDGRRRVLVPIPDKAAIVRRAWELVASHSFDEAAAVLTRETDRTWTRNAVKDIVRRGRVYLGFVVEKRGLDERPGRHEPILDEETYRAGLAGIAARQRGRIRRPPKRRLYLLAGVLHCGTCARRMTGQTVMSRGREWRYYFCRACPEPSVPGDQAETDVRARIRVGVLPAAAIDVARDELRRRLAVPRSDLEETRRRRLEQRIVQLRKQHEWRDIDDGEYRRLVAETRTELAAIPDADKLLLFDRNRRAMVTMAENLDRATLDQQAELVRILIERLTSSDRRVDLERIEWAPAAAPFFDDGLTVAPPDGLAGSVVTQDRLRGYAAS